MERLCLSRVILIGLFHIASQTYGLRGFESRSQRPSQLNAKNIIHKKAAAKKNTTSPTYSISPTHHTNETTFLHLHFHPSHLCQEKLHLNRS